jgi:hypothetical protein
VCGGEQKGTSDLPSCSGQADARLTASKQRGRRGRSGVLRQCAVVSLGVALVLGCQGTRAPVQPPAEANAVARKVLPGHDITMADALNVADCVAVGEVTRAPLPMGGHPGKAAAGFTFPLRVGFTARGPEIPKVTTCRERNMTKWEAEELRRRAVIVVGNLGEDGELAIAKVVDATRENAATVSGFGQSLFAALERSDDHWEWVWLASLARECDLAPPSDRPSATVRFLLADATHPDMKGIDVLTSRIAAMGDAAVPTLLAALRQTDSSPRAAWVGGPSRTHLTSRW